MNTNCDYEYYVKLRESLYDWFNEYEWKWFVSLVFPYSNIENTENYLKEWTQTICKKHNIEQICHMGVVIQSKITGNHIHLLMNSDNENDQIIQVERKKKNGKIIHKRCHIQPVYSNGCIDYIINKHTPHGRFLPLIPYNPDLLEKYRKLN